MIDPEELYARLASGDAGRIRAAAEPVTSAMSALTRAGSSLDGGASTAAAGWQGAGGGRVRRPLGAVRARRRRRRTRGWSGPRR